MLDKVLKLGTSIASMCAWLGDLPGGGGEGCVLWPDQG